MHVDPMHAHPMHVDPMHVHLGANCTCDRHGAVAVARDGNRLYCVGNLSADGDDKSAHDRGGRFEQRAPPCEGEGGGGDEGEGRGRGRG